MGPELSVFCEIVTFFCFGNKNFLTVIIKHAHLSAGITITFILTQLIRKQLAMEDFSMTFAF